MFGKEPALTIGAIQALLAMAVGYWFEELTPGLIMAAIAALLALLTRSQVSPTQTVDALIKTAIKMPANTEVSEVKDKLAEAQLTD